MQLMPGTARMLDADPNDPEQNIDAGTRLLRQLLLKYNGDVAKALAAYNAGSGAVDKYSGVPPYPETQSYVGKVIESYKQAGGH
jgi:soluble lytic murein transglycosylase-like protein